MSTSRKLQRRLAKVSLHGASDNLNKALAAVEEIKGLQGDLGSLVDLGSLLEETKRLVETQAAIQREVTIRLITALLDQDSGDALQKIRELEERIYGQVLAESGT